MTLVFNSGQTDDIKALARVRRISVTDKAEMAKMVSMLISRDLERFSPPEERIPTPPQPEKGAKDGD